MPDRRGNTIHPMSGKKFLRHLLPCALGLFFLTGCSGADGDAPAETWKISKIEKGKASWYSIRCNGGTCTASGERLRNEAPTAAHKKLPMGTKVRVTNLVNGKSEIVTINDRGPYIRGRIIDVTIGVAKRLDFIRRGVVPVKLEVLEPAKPDSRNDKKNKPEQVPGRGQ